MANGFSNNLSYSAKCLYTHKHANVNTDTNIYFNNKNLPTAKLSGRWSCTQCYEYCIWSKGLG